MSATQSLRHAARSLRRTPVFTIAATTTLVVGIAASVAIFALVNGVLLRPLPYGHPERLVGAWVDLPPLSLLHGQQSATTYQAIRKLSHTIADIGLATSYSVNVGDPDGGGAPQRIEAADLTATVVPLLQLPPLLGRSFSSDEDRPNGPLVVMISEQLWRTRFAGDRSVIGRTLDINGRAHQIIGVLPRAFRYPRADTQLWLPLALDPNATYDSGFNFNGIARLEPGVSLDDAMRDLASIFPRMAEIRPMFVPNVSTAMLLEQAKPRPLLVPFREDLTGGIANTLWMIAAAAGLVLLVACANVINLVLVRTDGRQRELAVREALGAGRTRLLGHFLAESAIVAAVAGAIGVLLAAAALRALVHYSPTEIPRLAEVSIDWATLTFAGVLTLLVALICSIVPALRIGGVTLANALREGGRSGTSGKGQQRLRGALVAGQIALAMMVLASSALLLRSFEQLRTIRPGFDAERVATYWMALPGARYPHDTNVVQFHSTLLQRVRSLPGVVTAGISSHLPLVDRGSNQNPFYAEGDEASLRKIPPLQIYVTIGGDYFETMRIPLIAGRRFAAVGVQRDGEAIISQRTAEQFFHDPTGQAAIGKRFTMLPGGPPNTIIGVVGSVRDTALAAPAASSVYLPEAVQRDTVFGNTHWTMALVIRTRGDPTLLARPVQRLVTELDPTLPVFDARPMTGVLRTSVAQTTFVMLILGAAAAVTLILGAIGLYGVLAYVVTLRTKELGVRIALGAAPASVAAAMARRGLVLTGMGIVAGGILFALGARYLSALLYGVSATDPLALAGASGVLVAIALLASWLPARRAARIDPAIALRSDG